MDGIIIGCIFCLHVDGLITRGGGISGVAISGSLRYSFVNRELMVMLRFQKYPDTCRRGLNLLLFCLSRCRRRRDCLSF